MSDEDAYKFVVRSIMNTSMTHVVYLDVTRGDGRRERVCLDPLRAVLLFPGDTYEPIRPTP